MLEERKYLKNLSRLVVYGLLALSVFFGLAVFIFVLRGQDTQIQDMPDLVGKYYVDVHNDLQRLQLRVDITKKHYPDQGIGIILYQSLPSGRSVRAREKLSLVVNQPKPVLLMPDYKRTSLAAAQAGLQKITYEDRLYKLDIGAVTNIQTNSYPNNTIIDQFPEAGVRISVSQKVYFLVATKATENQKNDEIDIKSLIGQNASLAMASLNKSGLDYRIKQTKASRNGHLDGTVYDIEKGNPVGIKMYFTPKTTKFRNGKEIVEVELDEAGRCVAEVKHLGMGGKHEIINEESRKVFITQNHLPDEKVKIYFFRQGRSELNVKCGESSVYRKVFVPDNLG